MGTVGGCVGCAWAAWVGFGVVGFVGWLCCIGLSFGLGGCLLWLVVLVNSVDLYIALMVCCVRIAGLSWCYLLARFVVLVWLLFVCLWLVWLLCAVC